MWFTSNNNKDIDQKTPEHQEGKLNKNIVVLIFNCSLVSFYGVNEFFDWKVIPKSYRIL